MLPKVYLLRRSRFCHEVGVVINASLVKESPSCPLASLTNKSLLIVSPVRRGSVGFNGVEPGLVVERLAVYERSVEIK